MGLLAFLAGPWGSLIEKGVLVLGVAGGIFFAVSQYNHHITADQMMRDQNAQLVQLEKDNQNLQSKISTLEQLNGSILVKLDQKNQRVIQTHDKVTTYIESPQGQKSNRATSDVIKKTIGMLNAE